MADAALVGEMQMQLRQHQADLQKTHAAIESITRNNSVVENSMDDIKKSNEMFVWESVGRSFVKISIEEYKEKLKTQIKENIDTLNSLNKKKYYLETSIKNTVDTLKKVIL